MKIAADPTDEVDTKQVEDFLSPILDVPEIGWRLVFWIKQVSQAAPVQYIAASAVKLQQLVFREKLTVKVGQV